jgi:hypothetical protein
VAPSVVAGLIDKPVIAVPTSIGYGASFGGLAALLGMLNSCAAGVTVVNIDNGFGAGFAASLINRVKEGNAVFHCGREVRETVRAEKHRVDYYRPHRPKPNDFFLNPKQDAAPIRYLKLIQPIDIYTYRCYAPP